MKEKKASALRRLPDALVGRSFHTRPIQTPMLTNADDR
jgi:hypothetical protein